jgi:mRNA interferase MazF
LKMESSLNRGSIWWVSLDPTKGSEIRKRRPCVIIGATPVNIARRTVVIVPLSTATQQENPPVTVSVQCLDRQAVAVCDQIRAVDKTRLVEHIGRLQAEDMDSISAALKQILVL